jgi:type I restriction enzyme, S subunit
MSSEWPVVAIEDVCNLIVDCVNKTAPVVPGPTPYRMIRTTNVRHGRIDISECRYVEQETYDKWTRRAKLLPGDLVLTREAPIGEVGLVTEAEGVFLGQRLMQYRANPERLDERFLLYSFLSPGLQHQFMSHEGSGSVVSHIRVGDCFKFKLRLPPLPVQRHIAELLGTLDDRITLLRETNTTLEAIAQTLFKSWFVKFDPVRAKSEGRAPEGMDEATAALFPDSFEESALGLVPKGWNVCAMKDVSSVGIGKTPPRKEQHWFSENPSDVRWVSIRDMGADGVYAKQTSEYLTKEAVEKFNVRLVPDSTVLMSFKMTIGRIAITDGEMTTNEAIAHFKLAPDAALTTEYIYLHLKQFDFSTLSSTSSIADAVNSKTVREIPILLASSAVLNAFQAQVAGLFAKMKITERQAQTLATLRDTLLPRLISGQLRLPEAEVLLEEACA